MVALYRTSFQNTIRGAGFLWGGGKKVKKPRRRKINSLSEVDVASSGDEGWIRSRKSRTSWVLVYRLRKGTSVRTKSRGNEKGRQRKTAGGEALGSGKIVGGVIRLQRKMEVFPFITL